MPERIFRGYREPRLVAVMAWSHHTLMLVGGALGLLAGPPGAIGAVAGERVLVQILWSAVFILAGILGALGRGSLRNRVEAVGFATAGSGVLLWAAALGWQSWHTGSGWQLVARFTATTVLYVIVAASEYAWTAQRDRYLRTHIDEAVADRAVAIRESLEGA